MTYLEEHAPAAVVEILDLADAAVEHDLDCCCCSYCGPDLIPGIDFPDGEW